MVLNQQSIISSRLRLQDLHDTDYNDGLDNAVDRFIDDLNFSHTQNTEASTAATQANDSASIS
jgi:hypothetical protein